MLILSTASRNWLEPATGVLHVLQGSQLDAAHAENFQARDQSHGARL